MVVWDGVRVTTRDSVEVAGPFSGAELRDAYVEALPDVTLGLARFRGNSIVSGPLELLRFGKPKVTRHEVAWPIEGGLLARSDGGTWRVRVANGRVEATVTGYTPRLPRLIYALSHQQVHMLFTRLFLLRLHGREPAPGPRASRDARLRAASIDAALILNLGRLLRRGRVTKTIAIAVAYHVACWSLTGRTLGGVVMRQRVVAVDGSRVTPAQSLLRLALLPVSWLTRRPIHDETAGTDVITD